MIATERKQWQSNQLPQEHKVPQQETRRGTKQAKQKFFMLGVRFVVICVVLCFLCLIKQVQIAKADYHLNAQKQQLQQLQDENQYLKVKIVELQSPQRIESIAKNKLGMVEPQNIQWLNAKK